MGKHRLGRVVEAQEATASKSEVLTRKVFGLKDSALISAGAAKSDGNAWIALKYYDASHECFSDWGADDLRLFSAFIATLAKCSWDTIRQHSGLRMKAIDLATIACGRAAFLRVQERVSKDISFVELRVNKSIRVHGFRMHDAFFLVLLDRDHRIYPE